MNAVYIVDHSQKSIFVGISDKKLFWPEHHISGPILPNVHIDHFKII